MTEPLDLDKSLPVILLESRRKALIDWLSVGQTEIKKHESEIIRHKQEAIDMLAEIEQIEAALKVLQKISHPENNE